MSTRTGIQLLPATDADYPVVQTLSSYYIYDFTEYLGWPCPASGRFGGCDEMFAEWQAGKNYPFLISVGGELAGFAAVALDTGTREFYIQEFFIVRKFRRQGVGKAVAYRLFEPFAGPWRVEWLLANSPARQFWQPALQRYLGVEALRMDEHASPWGHMQTLSFTREVAQDFAFADISSLHDGEMELHLERTIPSYPTRSWLPTYDFALRVDGAPAGDINLRIGNTSNILLYGGHIGYNVEPAFRGQHFAERACRLLFPLAQAHGLTTVWITTTPDNVASRRTCERLDARLVEIVPVPEDNDLFAIGDREKCRYRIDLPA
jgi:tagatose 1,6-diphosphate aldolase